MLSATGGGCCLPITASCFSNCAFLEQKEQLLDISELYHIFTLPFFISEKADKHKCEFCSYRLNGECELEVIIPQCKSENIRNLRLYEHVRLQRSIKGVGNRRSKKLLNLCQIHDEVPKKKETLLAKVEAMLAQNSGQSNLITTIH